MDFYLLFKFVHVVSAVVWVGGGLCLTVLGVAALRRRDETEMLRIIDSVAFLGNRMFMPASLLTLVSGAVATTLAGLWGELWVILGLAGFAAAFVTGAFVFKPVSDRLKVRMRAGQQAEAVVEGERLLQLAKFDYSVMAFVIADMVFKPVPGDLWTLSLMALLLLAGASFLLASRRRIEPAVTT